MEVFILIIGVSIITSVLDFSAFIFTGKSFLSPVLRLLISVVIVAVLPVGYLCLLDEATNDCCNDSATFAPEHKLTIYVVIGICIIAYFVSFLNKKIISPIIETLINTVLLGAIVLNIFISLHLAPYLWLFGNLSVILLFILELMKNQKKVRTYSSQFDVSSLNRLELLAWKFLNWKLLFKVPVLLILCLPLMVFVSGFLLLFGQKPDSIIRSFTDTYKHGLSQLDYMCENVECGHHFLCSVAANGHSNVVSPMRLGERGGGGIICNRQLLVANAFEELVQDKLPKAHRFIRRNYNRVGNVIHRYYGVFNLKFVADIIYVLMKPLEWFFLLVLYTFDQNPENRIAKQYLSPKDRSAIEKNV